jgi:glycosyltransferase involved in cell wall biosynthesis
MKEMPLVSVCVITYNQERFIGQAIEGVLSQETDFAYELVIGEDHSTDSTREKIGAYLEEYPSLIKLLDSEPNLGIARNVSRTMSACCGKYIAICEGDDYWIDPRKLQKQVDFLENNPEYSAAGHQAWVIYQDIDRDGHYFKEHVASTLFLEDVLGGRPFHTAALVFRSELIRNNPLPVNITSCDRALFILCAVHGPLRFFDEPMCVYRKNSSGISAWVTADLMKNDLNIIPWIKSIYPAFPSYRYLSLIHRTIVRFPARVSIGLVVKHYFLYLLYSFSYFPKNVIEVARFTVNQLPGIVRKSCSTGLL